MVSSDTNVDGETVTDDGIVGGMSSETDPKPRLGLSRALGVFCPLQSIGLLSKIRSRESSQIT